MTAWSYSSITLFEQCPKKYYHTRVAKDFKDEDSTATIYGKEGLHYEDTKTQTVSETDVSKPDT